MLIFFAIFILMISSFLVGFIFGHYEAWVDIFLTVGDREGKVLQAKVQQWRRK